MNVKKFLFTHNSNKCEIKNLQFYGSLRTYFFHFYLKIDHLKKCQKIFVHKKKLFIKKK